MATTKEEGNIFFFYRPKVEAESSRDIQRFYIVMQSDENYRLLLVGRKKLPKDDDASSLSRNWVLVREVTEKSDTIEDILEAAEYETKTKGTQHLPPAAPVAEGRYAIVEIDGQTALNYKLKREAGDEMRDLFGLQKKASLIIAVKNPEVHVDGFPDAKPDYSEELQKKFKDRRWIPVEDMRLLNYSNVQLVLISALDESTTEQLGISSDKAKAVDLADEIDLDLPKKALLEKTFPKLKEFSKSDHELKDIRFGEGGKKGGKQASESGLSASGLARLLSGIELPKNKTNIIEFAEKHAERVDHPELAINRLKKMEDKEYRDLADIQEAVAKSIRKAAYRCEICGEEFETPSELKQHLKTSHPQQAVSAADLEKALSGISYPKEKNELLKYAKENKVEDKVLETIASLPDRKYEDAAEITVAFQEAITGEERDEKKAPSKKALESDSAAAVTKALKGIELPKSKEDILAFAKDQNTREELLNILEKLPDQQYEDMSDVAKAVGKVKG